MKWARGHSARVIVILHASVPPLFAHLLFAYVSAAPVCDCVWPASQGRNACWDYPGGCVVINLDKYRTLMLTDDNNHFEPAIVQIRAALNWMLKTPGVFGVTIQMSRGIVICELFATVFFEEHGNAHIEHRADRLTDIVESWAA